MAFNSFITSADTLVTTHEQTRDGFFHTQKAKKSPAQGGARDQLFASC